MVQKENKELCKENEALRQQLEKRQYVNLGCEDINKKGSLFDKQLSLKERRQKCTVHIGDKLLHHWNYFMIALTAILGDKAYIDAITAKRARYKKSVWTSLITEKFYSNKNLHEKKASNN